MAAPLPTELYRLPWTLTDNILSWLEPTKRCNLYCEGCYSKNDPKSDKSFEQVRADMDAFVSQRTVDSISIAGGDPLVHPRIVDIVRMIHDEYGLKPVLNTNALALTPELTRQLRDAGAYGFTFHIDSSQRRPHWKDKNELELCELRLHYARQVAEVGGMCVAFNSTVFPHTVHYVPELVKWAEEHIDIVHGMVFILFRTSRMEEHQYFANGKPVDTGKLVYYGQERNPRPLWAQEVVEIIQEKADPAFMPAAYLGGTKDPNSFKWLLTGRVGHPGKVLGYVGPKTMEIIQTTNHFINKRYLAYVRPEGLRQGRRLVLGLSPFDKKLRSMIPKVLRQPWKRQHFQSILIIQPVDWTEHHEANMCDGCPDMTVHNGKLVWSCRLEEMLNFGCFLSAGPKKKAEEAAKTEPAVAK